MKPEPVQFLDALRTACDSLESAFSVKATFNPEDQLKAPISALVKAAGKVLGLKLDAVTEVHGGDLPGRPDIGIAVNKLVSGHIELKAPGKGADPSKFKIDADRAQWKRFQDLPNLVYTDSVQWALYRNGERIGKVIRLSGSPSDDGRKAVDEKDAESLFSLLATFFAWQPIVPSTPKALAAAVAPLCRLLRTDVRAALGDPGSSLSALATDWRKYLFPDADNDQFADAYAQTLTYALLLARFSGGSLASTEGAVKAIRKDHRLLADALKILTDDAARVEIATAIDLLERTIAAVDSTILSKKAYGDPWLYFYEDFLAEYDPDMRKNRGVYYTPVPVVSCQVKLVGELLRDRFSAENLFADAAVMTLDPACGTGTYLLAALDHSLDEISSHKGAGMRASAATTAAHNLHAFELLVGPYAVAHLRLAERLLAEGGSLAADGVHVYLTDTLEAPSAAPPGHLPLIYRALGEEHERAQVIKSKTPIVVCLGNPPYNREGADIPGRRTRKGGWVRFGDEHREGEGILKDFTDPLKALGAGVHAKNLFNDYVYFWRWALWKVFETQPKSGIVSFITASSYLVGPGFAGMRQVMRQTFDTLWIIDLEGGNLGARKTENVFAIQTPVAIAIGACFDAPNPLKPAEVHYSRISGTQEEKFIQLRTIRKFSDLAWQSTSDGWTDPFLPDAAGPYASWPRITDLFPWQESGLQFKRSWPIGEHREVLEARWHALLGAINRGTAFHETRDRKVGGSYPSLDKKTRLKPIAGLPSNEPCPRVEQYSFRSFDRRWALLDNRLGDFLRPSLQASVGPKQVFLTSFLTEVLGEGPAAVATELLPDLHHFRGSFGGAHVIPLWRDSAAQNPNICHGVLSKLEAEYKQTVKPDDLFAYVYGILASPKYVMSFWDALRIPGPRIPISKSWLLFCTCRDFGFRLLWLHTFGNRYIPRGTKARRIPQGKALCKVGTPSSAEKYPEDFRYDPEHQELRIGNGIFANVRPDVWNFSISGFAVLQSWLAFRVKDRAGKRSSPLDEIRPQQWLFDEELLSLLWVLEHTIDLAANLGNTVDAILASSCFSAADFPEPDGGEREPPEVQEAGKTGTLF